MQNQSQSFSIKNKFSSPFYCFVSLIKSMIGICILDIPYVANQAGYVWSCILIIMTSLLTIRSAFFILEVADDITSEEIQYGEVVRKSVGKILAKITDISIMLQQGSLCIAYVLFFVRFFCMAAEFLGIRLVPFNGFIIAFIVLTPIIFLRDIKMLEHFNLVGVSFAFISIMAIFAYQGNILIYGSPISLKDIIAFNFQNTYIYISITFIAFEGNQTLFPIRTVFEDKKQFRQMLGLSIILVAMIYVLFIIISVFALGNKLDQIIIFNLPTSQIWGVIVIFMYVIQIMLTYPIQILPIHLMIDALIENNSKHIIFSAFLKMILLLTILFLAYFTPNISWFLGLIGSIFGIFLQFIIPVISHWFYFRTKNKFTLTQYLVILSISTLCLTKGIQQSIQQITA